jgi:hypothetical protein
MKTKLLAVLLLLAGSAVSAITPSHSVRACPPVFELEFRRAACISYTHTEVKPADPSRG